MLHHLVSIFLLLCVCSECLTASDVVRGNFLPKLQSMLGIPVNEQLHKRAMNYMFGLTRIPPNISCTSVQICSKSSICTFVCLPGSVYVPPFVSFATRTQSALSIEYSFCHHQSIGTHNSAISSAYGFGTEDSFISTILSASHIQFRSIRTNSHFLSITDQLNMGVRHVELDIHWFNSQHHISHCGFTVPILNYLFRIVDKLMYYAHIDFDSETIGCRPSFNGISAGEQPLAQTIVEEIANWLNEPRNRNEFVILYLDTSSNVNTLNITQSLVEIFESAMGDMIVRSDDSTNRDILRRGSMRTLAKQGKRVMIVSRREFKTHKGLVFAKSEDTTCSWNEPQIALFFDPIRHSFDESACFLAWKKNPSKIKYTRLMTNQLMYGFANSLFVPAASNGINIMGKNIHQLMECGANTLGTDLLTYDHIMSSIWTWDPLLNIEELKEIYPAMCTAFNTTNGRWTVVPCESELRVICQGVKDPSQFVVSVSSLRHPEVYLLNMLDKPVDTQWMSICPSGFGFTAPSTAYFNKSMYTYLGKEKYSGLFFLGFLLEKYLFE